MDEDINLYLTKKKLFLTMSTENTTLISVMLAYLALASPELGTAQPQLVICSRYIHLGIVNGARGFVHSFEYDTKKGKTEKLKRIWVVFPNKATGSFLREDMKRKGITNKENPLAVPISEIKLTFELLLNFILSKKKEKLASFNCKRYCSRAITSHFFCCQLFQWLR